jgi:hypothetical protein
VGDKVEVIGTIADDGKTVKATSMEHDEHAAAARVVLASPLTSVSAGATAGTFNVVMLGQTAIVDADTRIADRTTPGSSTFNITNFDTYLQGKTPYVVLRTVVDSAGALHAVAFDIVPAPNNGFVGVAGRADADPVTAAGVTTVMVHGVSVIFDPTKTMATVANGSFVLAVGALTTAGAVDSTVTRGRFIAFPIGGHDDDHDVDMGG